MRFILGFACIVSMLGAPSFAEGLAGSYLAGRQASLDGRLDASVQYFSKVVAQDSANIMALEQLILAPISVAVPIPTIAKASSPLS